MRVKSDVRDCYCLHTRRAARLLTQFYDDRLRPTGLRVTQFTLLAAVREMQPVAQQPLAELLGMDRTTLTRNLSLLQREGRVTVGKEKDDLRTNRIRLTRNGEKAVEDALPVWTEAHREVTRRLKAEGLEAAAVVALVDRLGDVTGEE